MSERRVDSLVWMVIAAALVTAHGCGSAADFEGEPDVGLDAVAPDGPDPEAGAESADGVQDDAEPPAYQPEEDLASGPPDHTEGDVDPSIFPCTEEGIRDAIAEGGGPHFFECDGSQTVVTQATIEVNNDVILDGQNRLTIDANGLHRVLSVAADTEVALVGMTVRGGTIGRDDPLSYGGGIYNEGELTLANVSISDNAAAHGGGGIYNAGSLTLKNATVSDNAVGLVEPGLDNAVGGGIANAGNLTIVASIISDNTATMYGAGLHDRGTTTILDSAVSGNEAWSYGGGVYSSGDLVIERTTISENSGIDGGAGIHSAGTLALVDSSVLRNRGSGIDSEGTLILTSSSISSNDSDGVYHTNGEISVTNSSIWGNANYGLSTFRATLTVTGSTIWGNGWVGISTSGTTSLVNSTVSGDPDCIRYFEGTLTITHSTVRGTVAVGSWREGPTAVELKGTIIDGSCSVVAESPTLTSYGYNIESPGDTCGANRATDQPNVARHVLGLGPLADNGGPVLSHAPGRVAIDVIPAEDCVDADGHPLTTDQRGEPRDDGMCDVGALEVQR